MLYTPKKTIQAIVETGNHYVAQVKGNQLSLLKDIKAQATQNPIDTFIEKDNTRGRKVTRTISTFSVENPTILKGWQNVKTYIVVHRNKVEKGIVTDETAYFIADLSFDAERFHQIIKQHWGVENKLHWVKDVIHNEDNNRIRCGSGPIAASIFSSIAINIHRKEYGNSITDNQILFRANVKELFNITRT